MTAIKELTPVTTEPVAEEESGHESEVGTPEITRSISHSHGQDDGDDLENTLSRVSSGPPYSVFSLGMIRWIVAMHCISAFISPVTANIYFPAIPALSRDLGVGVEKINLTLTTYMIFQALSPTFFGDFGDAAGRRPAFIIAFLIYIGANVGLALQRNYAALLVLRMLQSSGSSGTLALVYAVVADIVPSSGRGKWMGVVGAGITVGPAIGPAIVVARLSTNTITGGLLNAYLNWPWIFWFLIIVTAAWLIPYILAIPETARKVVGNGSIPPQGWNVTLLDYIRFRNQTKLQPSASRRQKIPIPNPLNTLKVLRHKDMAMILLYNGCLFLCFSTVTATLASQFQQIYGYDELVLGLFYLPIGGSTTIASIGGGFIADWNFRRLAKKTGFKIDRKTGNDMANFPLEKARIQLIAPLIYIGAGACIGYGWALENRVNVVVPLVLSFFIGLCVTWPFQIMNLLVIDTYSEAPATATAANNLVRCLAGAAATAAIEPIIQKTGRGWAYTILALLIIVPSPVLFIVAKNGKTWRNERIQRMIEKAAKEEAKVDEKQVTPNEGVEVETTGGLLG
ncbi:chloramphenicol resistance protein [Xylaria nigripes]|nr:chloramphenicol resistance protein [Xylaria nigripes]